MSVHAHPVPDVEIRSVWIKLLSERAQSTPTREPSDLRGLAELLDELVA